MTDTTTPSYHDLYVTTATIPRTSIFNLPYGLEVSCNRVNGWSLWDMNQTQPPVVPAVGNPPSRGVEIAGEYSRKWLVLDVAGHVIVDSRTPKGRNS